MTKKLSAFAKRQRSDDDACLLFFISNGGTNQQGNYIMTSDRIPVYIQSIVNDVCRASRTDKPKIFFFVCHQTGKIRNICCEGHSNELTESQKSRK